MNHLEVSKEKVIGWYCQYCQSYNDILTDNCKICNLDDRPSSLSLMAFETRMERLGYFVDASEINWE